MAPVDFVLSFFSTLLPAEDLSSLVPFLRHICSLRHATVFSNSWMYVCNQMRTPIIYLFPLSLSLFDMHRLAECFILASVASLLFPGFFFLGKPSPAVSIFVLIQHVGL